MRVPPGTRAQIAKFITNVESINDPDVVYGYARDIAAFYTSDYKTDERILIQHEKDIEVLVRLYNMCNQFCYGHIKINELDYEIKPNSRYEQAVINSRYALEFLIYEAAANKVFLSIDKLDSLGLKNIRRRTIKFYNFKEVSDECKSTGKYLKEWCNINKDAKIEHVTESLYDYAIHFYKMNGCLMEYPDIPKDLQRIFKYNKENYQDFCDKCKGKKLEDIARLYDSVDYLDKCRAEKVIVRYFITNLIDSKMESTEEDKYYQRFRRCLGKK